MKPVKITLLIALAIVFVNVAGLLLRFYQLDTYFILFGFRFQLSLVIPFFFVLRKENFSDLKSFLFRPRYIKPSVSLFWIFVPFLILLSALYIMNGIKTAEPEYLYEFGLSSVFDLPVYMIWNFPQLILFFLFLSVIGNRSNKIYTIPAIVIVLLFIYLFVPLKKESPDYSGLASLLLCALSISLILKHFGNIYWLSIIVFMIFWLNMLAFGSDSSGMIHILFAARYRNWEGFFQVAPAYVELLLPAQLFITYLFIYFKISSRKKREINFKFIV